MTKSLKLILILIIGFATVFGSSFLLDIPIIKENTVRIILVYILLLIECYLIIQIYKEIASM